MTFDKQKARSEVKELESATFWTGPVTIHQIQTILLGAARLSSTLDRIDELEKALIEERAKTVEVFWHPGFDFVCIEGLKLDEAREQLHAEGLI